MMPQTPFGRPLAAKRSRLTCGATAPVKSRISPTAKSVTISSKAAACWTPQRLSAVKATKAIRATIRGSVPGRQVAA